MKILDFNGIKVRWYGHDSFRFDIDGKILYIDPFEVKDSDKADMILITHEHYDHCSIADLKKLTKGDTIIIATPDTTSKLSGKVDGGHLKLAVPGDSFNFDWITIKAVPAYNVNKPFHPRDNQWVGYVFKMKGITFYHAGDTDIIPEMSEITCDVAFLPISGTYVMNVEEAALAAKKIMPKIAIPMHYGKIIGEKSDALEFAKLCTFCQVKVME